MSADNRGGVLMADVSNSIEDYSDARMRRNNEARALPGTIISIVETRDGTRWLGTEDDGLFCAVNGHYVLVSGDAENRNINSLLPAPSGGLWIGTNHGLQWWIDGSISRYQVKGLPGNMIILAMARDKDNNLWLGTDRGLIRIAADGQATFDPQSSTPVTAVYVDRDDALWFGGGHGLERSRDGTFTPYTQAQGLPSNENGPLYVAPTGRIWFAPLSGGLYWYRNGKVHSVTLDGLAQDVVYSIDGSEDTVWAARQRGGLTRLTFHGATLTATTYCQSQGLAEDSVFTVLAASDGSVWAGTVSGGASRLQNGRFETFTHATGMSSNTVNAMAQGADGAIWLATPNGLDEYQDGKWRVLTTSEGLPSSDVRALFEDEEGVLWIGTSGGLAYLQSGKLYALSHLPEPLREPVFGIAQDELGSLWFATSDHILEANREDLLANRSSDENLRIYGIDDGLPGVEGVDRSRSMVTDGSHRIWMSVHGGLAMTDPELTFQDAEPATVRLEAVTAGSQKYRLNQPLRIPPGSGSISWTFGVDTLADLQRIRFRHRLVGLDRRWSSISSSRQVTYSNLSPGEYRFEVEASNAAGLWNGPVRSVAFTIEPAFWQTWWFRALVLVLCLLVLVAVYQLRVYQMMREMDLLFQERLAERTRIAQDLHDTLLQGVLSASMQLDLAAEQVPENSPAKRRLRRVTQLMNLVADEGRNALRGLRVADDTGATLAEALSQFAERRSTGEGAAFRVVLQSEPRPVRALIRDEVLSIGREAIANAFRHSGARNVKVELEYSPGYLRMTVKDDGCGIDPAVLSAGREGHWGLIGMKERSESIGGRLRLRSRLGAGSEIELTVPGAFAFVAATRNQTLKWCVWPWRNGSAKVSQSKRGE
jgi:signal transduction histidine kinase